uniref:Uncharacterized protein n=1 Tax=Anguilla anguilla TaxID=7936 RepID=A0A0E9SQZ6_ANGAN
MIPSYTVPHMMPFSLRSKAEKHRTQVAIC